MRTALTLLALATFAFVGQLALAQDEEADAKKLRRIDPKAKTEAEKAPSTDELDEKIAALQAEMNALDQRRRKVTRELRSLQRQRRNQRRDSMRQRFAPRGSSGMEFDFGIGGGPGGLRVFGMNGSPNVGLRIQSGPDGIRVEVSERDEDGELQTKTYEAKDMEAFVKQFPEIAKQHGIGALPGIGFMGGSLEDFDFDMDDFGGMEDLQERLEELRERLQGGLTPMPPTAPTPGLSPFFPRRPQTAPAPRERLGVMVSPVDAERSEELALDEGEGLLVQEVQPNSLAARLGLRPGDVLLSVGGVTIEGASSISKSLGAIEAKGKVKVEIDRPGRGSIVLEAPKTASKLRGKRV